MSADLVAAPEVEMTIEMLQQIVALKVANVPDWQISKGFGIEEDLLGELYKTEEYEKEFAKHFAEKVKELGEVNDGWDGLERKALVRLNSELDKIGFMDPDFALKVAIHANKAARRPLVGNRPIDAQQGGTAVIYINGNFVNQMQALKIEPRNHSVDVMRNKKMNDFIDPNQVEGVLLEGNKTEKPLEDMLEEWLSKPMDVGKTE